MKTFADHAQARRDLIKAGTIHPSSLIELAQDRIRRLREWTDGSECCARLMAEAREVLTEGKALTAEFNAARA